MGGAGVVDALRRLSAAGLVELRRDYVPYLERSTVAQPDFDDADAERSLWMGEVGIRLVLQRLSPSAENLERLAELVEANAEAEQQELMWGSPGTILIGRELGLDVDEAVDWLRAQRDRRAVDAGSRRQSSGTSALRTDSQVACARLATYVAVSETLRRLSPVAFEDGLVNWPAVAGAGARARDGQIRTQWCHGAPGIVATLAHLLDTELAVAGGELTWRAGPLLKGANLCHGTAGNGYAFLALHELTADEDWLVRARARSRCTPSPRWRLRARSTGGAGTRSGRGPRHRPLPRRLPRRPQRAAASLSRR